MRSAHRQHPAWHALPAVALATAISLAVTGTALATPDPTTKGSAGSATRAVATAASAATARTLTLVTGDRVTLGRDGGDKQSVAVYGADGADTLFQTETDAHGHLYVIPYSALALLAEGTLDRGLFDVTQLIANGYDDAGTGEIPLIVDYSDKPSASALTSRAKKLPGARGTTPLTALGAGAIRVDKDRAGTFVKALATAPKVRKVWLDGKVEASLDVSVPLIGAPRAWAAGLDGKGVKVAVLDSGIDLNHPDVKDRIADYKSFIEGSSVQDRFGHGTHVASTIAGSGAASGGKYKGVAPEAQLLIGKVLDDTGRGTESQILAGMQWAAASGAKVVNMSLGGGYSDGSDPMSQAVNELSAASGTLFVVAAGNWGQYGEGTVSTPSAADAALAVAAYSKQDTLAPFSSRGPRTGDHALKPDIAAPGVAIAAARAAGTTLGTPVNSSYTRANGTSMATPHVVGAAAILAQEHPDWSGQRIKDALMSTAERIEGDSPYQQGAGRVDVEAATESTVTASGKADFGEPLWQEGQRPEVTRTVTYANSGDTAAVLKLTADMGALPASALALSDGEVTVPAGGSTSVTLALDPNSVRPGRYSGALTATAADGSRVHTVLAGIVRGPQRALSLTFKGRHGGTPSAVSMIVQSEDGTYYQSHTYGRIGSLKLDLPAGRYSVIGAVSTDDGSARPQLMARDLFSLPSVDLEGGDQSLTVDAGHAKDVSLDVPDESRPLARSSVSVQLHRALGTGLRDAAFGFTALLNGDSVRIGAIPQDEAAFGKLTLTRWQSVRQPIVRALVNEPAEEAVQTLVPTDSARFDGIRRLQLADAGTGTSGDYSGLDVTGRIVLLRAADPGSASFLTNGAISRGAAAVILMRDQPGALRVSTGQNTAVPVLAVDYRQGQRLRELLAGGPVRLRLDGVKESTYTYQAQRTTSGIPSDLTLSAPRSAFAVEKARFHSDGITRRGFEARYTWDELSGPYSARAPQYLDQPAARTDYVLPSPGAQYQQQVSAMGGEPDTLREGLHSLTAGETTSSDWYRAPSRPSVVSMSGCSFCRTDSDMVFAPSRQGDSEPDHYAVDGPSGTWSYYRDGQQVSATDLPVDGPADYRFVLDTRRGVLYLGKQKLSETTHTEWSFRSQPPTGNKVPDCSRIITNSTMCEGLPVILLGYDVPLDLNNKAPAGREFTFAVDAVRPAEYSGDVPVVSTTVQVSYDNGASWHDASVTGGNRGAYRATVHHPASADTDGYVSLKVRAEDADGNSTLQIVNRAYALK